MTVALCIVCLVQAGALVYAFKTYARSMSEHAEGAALERASLLNRIQAPVAAVAASVGQPADEERAVHPDLPQEYWDAISEVEQLEGAAS